MLEPIRKWICIGVPHRHDDPWKLLWLTHKQASILADRSIPKPGNRGEAADMIAEIAKKEKWDR